MTDMNMAKPQRGSFQLSCEESSKPIMVFHAETLGIVYANPAAFALYGYSPSELATLTLEDLHPESERATLRAFLQRAGTVGETTPGVGPWIHRRADGSTFEAEITSHRVEGEAGELRLAVVRDVSEQQERCRVARRQALLFQNVSDAVVISDLEGRIMEWNPAAERMWGYRAPEVTGRTAGFLNPDGEGEALVGEILDSVRRGETWEGEVTLVRKDGSRGCAACTVVPVRDDEGQIVASMGINRDITAQRSAEARAEEREDRFRLLAEQIPHIIWMASADGSVKYYNKGWEDYSGLLRTDGHGTGWLSVVHPDDLQATLDRWDHAVRTGEEYSVTHRIRAADGSFRWHISRATPVRDVHGRITRWFGTATDIHDQKMAEVAVSEREEFYRAMFENAHDGIFLYDLESDRLLDLNAQTAAIFGLSVQHMRGRSLQELSPHYEDRMRRVRKIREQGGGRFEMESTRPDGQKIVVELNATLMDFRGRKVGLGVIRDVTEQRQLQRQVHMSQRLESIGRLAGGIAHDFNNFLTAIRGFALVVDERRRDDDSETGEAVKEIVDASDRAASMTRQLLAYSRQQVLDPEVLDLNDLVASTEKLLRQLLGADIDIVLRLGSELDAVYADSGQLQQVLMNLAVNARDAMPDGGRLLIETRNEQVDEEHAASHPAFKPGEYVVLEVTDSGHGMDPATVDQIFDPFFTTKAPGEGTGLGLATVFGIVKQSGGFIWPYSEPGVGTSFRVYLPVTRRAPRLRSAEIQTPPAVSGGGKTVLVAEDERAIRLLARKTLERESYRVLEAATGVEALDLLGQHGDGIDLLLTDMVMPSMGGKELAGHLRTLHPALPVIFMSGYSRDFLAERGDVAGERTVLEKPFTPRVLLEAVARATT